MTTLTIRRIDAQFETIVLSKSQPISIGRHSSNDVCIDEEDVFPMHCRISWNKTGFEVVAAGAAGVDVNHTPVRNKILSVGDVLHVGTADIFVHDDDDGPDDSSVRRKSSSIPLRPVSEDGIKTSWMQRGEKSKPGDAKDFPPPLPGAPIEDEHDWTSPDSDERNSSAARKRGQNRRSLSRAVRPGEQDVLKSPLVISLFGGSLALALAGATFWFVIGRNLVQNQFDAATEAMADGQHAQAITLFQEFLDDYPNNSRSETARIALSKSRVLRATSGGSPSWQSGLELTREFIKQHRDSPLFHDQHGTLCKFAEDISIGAARSAERQLDRSYLGISTDAEVILVRHSPVNSPPKQAQRKIRTAVRSAEAAILKQETLDEALANMQLATTDGRPIDALDLRARLLDRYPDLRRAPAVEAALATAISAERDTVVVNELDVAASSPPPATSSGVFAPLMLIPLERSISDVSDSGRIVVALAQGSCVGFDSATGMPQWRRHIGADSPFFPRPVTTTVPGLLVFDTRLQALLMLNRLTGEAVWSQTLGDDLSGSPLIIGGQILLPTLGGHLYKMSLETGKISSRLDFSQELLAPAVALSDDEHVLVLGHRSVAYTLRTRPLECVAVSFVGHSAGAVQGPAVAMGGLVMVPVSEESGSTSLQVFDARSQDHGLAFLESHRVAGVVHDSPVIRGNQLFVASRGDRVAAFTVSDDPSERALTAVATYQSNAPGHEAIHMHAGPENQLWLAAGVVTRLRLENEKIVPVGKSISVRGTPQPIQMIGEDIFIARRGTTSPSISFAQADRESMISRWKARLGLRLIACDSVGDSALLCITDRGDLIDVAQSNLESGGFLRRSRTPLFESGDASPAARATRLHDGRSVVDLGGDAPQLSIIDASGVLAQSISLPTPLQAAPVSIAEGIALPRDGRIAMHFPDGRTTSVEDFVAPLREGLPSPWTFTTRVGGNDLIASGADGTLYRIQYRTEPLPHLAEAARTTIDDPVDVPFAISGNRLFVADAAARLQVFDVDDLSLTNTIELPLAASGPLWIVDGRLLVEVGRRELHSYEIGEQLTHSWTVPLEGHSLAGPPVAVDGRLVFARVDGTVASVRGTDGSPVASVSLGEGIQIGPRRVGEHLVVVSLDGSLYQVNVVLKSEK